MARKSPGFFYAIQIFLKGNPHATLHFKKKNESTGNVQSGNLNRYRASFNPLTFKI